jgi:hypothetical protein
MRNSIIIYVITVFLFLSCKNENLSTKNLSLNKEEKIVDFKDTINFEISNNYKKFNEKKIINLDIDSIEFKEKLKLTENKFLEINKDYEGENNFTLETTNCFIKFNSNLSVGENYMNYKMIKIIGNYYFVQIGGIDGVTTMIIDSKKSFFQLIPGQISFNKNNEKFLITTNDVYLCNIFVFRILNKESIKIDKKYFSKDCYVQNIEFGNNDVIQIRTDCFSISNSKTYTLE